MPHPPEPPDSSPGPPAPEFVAEIVTAPPDALAVVPRGAAGLSLADDRAAEREALRQTAALTAASTQRAYAADWRRYVNWAASGPYAGIFPVPATAVAKFLDACAAEGLSAQFLDRLVSGIAHHHRMQGEAFYTGAPIIRSTIQKWKRLAPAAQRKVEPITNAVLRRFIDAARRHPDPYERALRPAVLLLGRGLATRRAELVALNVADVRPVAEGLLVRVAGVFEDQSARRTKTNQEGKKDVRGVAYAVDPQLDVGRALAAWLPVRLGSIPPDEVALFGRPHARGAPWRLRDGEVATMIKEAAATCGLDPEGFSGHSLRRGLVTEARLQDRSFDNIITQTKHATTEQARGYADEAVDWKTNVTKGLT